MVDRNDLTFTHLQYLNADKLISQHIETVLLSLFPYKPLGVPRVAIIYISATRGTSSRAWTSTLRGKCKIVGRSEQPYYCVFCHS